MAPTAVIPVHQGGASLRRCLTALVASTLPPSEIIVVDDGSTDGSGDVAREFGARVIRLPYAPRGPAAARNAGAAAATGSVLLFLDADVEVHRDTVALVARHFDEHPDSAAVFGSYDANPSDPGFGSQYKNLLHHFIHQHGQRAASTFWTGCGAIRREVFAAVGGFNETTYRRSSIEDIELGTRLVSAGHRVALRPDIQVTHLKRWTVAGIVRSDIVDRAVPWTRLILQNGLVPKDLNLAGKHRVSAAAAWVLLVTLATSPFVMHAFWASAVAAGVLLMLNAPFWSFLWKARGAVFVMKSVPLYVSYLLYSSAAFAGIAMFDGVNRAARPREARVPVERSPSA